MENAITNRSPATIIEPESGLDDLAALLAEQISASHAAATRAFAIAADEDEFGEKARNDALKIATRLMHASAQAATAIKRVKDDGEFHYRVTVNRIDVDAEKEARKARRLQAHAGKDDTMEKLEQRMIRIYESTRARLTDEEKAILDKMAGSRRGNIHSVSAALGMAAEMNGEPPPPERAEFEEIGR